MLLGVEDGVEVGVGAVAGAADDPEEDSPDEAGVFDSVAAGVLDSEGAVSDGAESDDGSELLGA